MSEPPSERPEPSQRASRPESERASRPESERASRPGSERQPPEPQGPPLRALAMVLISLAIVFAALGLFSITGSDTDTATAAADGSASETSGSAPASAAPTSAQPSSAAPSSSRPTTGSSATSTTGSSATSTASAATGPVRVLNNSNIAGLAARTAETLESSGFTVGETGNYSGGTIASTSVYYDPAVPGQQAQAERVAAALGVSAEPRFAGIEDATPGIVVIVTQ